ncbi:hypothetical protein FB45DRAFT_842767 [Roridomyces roridus]|uniref:F-box domain-containing protein n=1 Tax=Roridomyces roridus TaxID=1738132 RepID=A0AAD7FDA0_9AGAR|nr:hypothetical protein FB45DRAFT_842767 [Roridomyces roridus]
MHRGLGIPEILSNICELIPNDTERDLHCLDSGTNHTLAALARTCRAFQNPALDVLWNSQFTILNVIRCMPEDIWEWTDEELDEDDEDEEVSPIALKRPVFPEDWERPLYYARRVRHFALGDEHVPSACYDILRVSLPAEHLFPKIETLQLYTTQSHVFPNYPLFLGPRLTTLHLGVCQSVVHLTMLLDLATQCPRLQEVTIRCSELEPSPQLQAFSFVAIHLKELRSLNVPCLDGPSLDHLSGLASLEFMALVRQPVFDIPSVPARIQAEDCHVHGEMMMNISLSDTRAVSEVLSRFQARSVRMLIIELPRDTRAAVFLECCSVVVAQCRGHPPSSLTIRCETFPKIMHTADQIAVYKVPVALLSPLFIFENLTSVYLAAPVGFDLDDDSVASLARAWPRIHYLSLVSSMSKNVPSRATLLALLSFAKHCPFLSSLTLSLDAKVVPTIASGPDTPRPQQRALSSLVVCDSPIDSPLAVAVFLSSLFPRLRNVSSRGGLVDLAAQWKAVDKALPLVGVSRTEE